MRGIGVAVITSTSGLLALAAERRALGDAEAVLLVDHGQAEARGSVTPSCTSACVPTTQPISPAAAAASTPLARLPAHRVGEERHLARRAAPRSCGQRQEVLLGQDLGGRHERGLVAGLDRGEDGERGHHRLARAHVALQQPVHRVGLGHVGPDLAPDPLLGRGQRGTGSDASRRRASAPGGFMRDARARGPRAAGGSRARAGGGRSRRRRAAAAPPPARPSVSGKWPARSGLGQRHEARAARGAPSGSGSSRPLRVAVHEALHAARGAAAAASPRVSRVDRHQAARVQGLVRSPAARPRRSRSPSPASGAARAR